MSAAHVIRGGTVHDGGGGPTVVADVLVRDGRIAMVGQVGACDAVELDAHGCLVAPGFIDVHSHSDYTLVVDPRAVSSVHQGVTTEIVGNCGFGCFPIRDAAVARHSIYGFRDDVGIDWRDADGYFARLQAGRPAVNVLSLVPNAQLRISAMADPARVAGPGDVARMARLLREALEAGAAGYSTGLEYPVEERASEDEIVALARIAAAAGGIYATHTRDRGGDGVAGVEEAIRTARRAGARLQLSHLLPRGGPEGGERCVELVDEARAEGLDVAFDQHTRPHGFTYLRVALPPEALAAGTERLRALLDDPAARARMRGYRGLLGDDFGRVVLLDHPRWPEYGRRDLAAIAAERGQVPLDAVHDLLRDALDGGPPPMVILPCYTPAQQRDVFAHGCCMPASDATALAPDGLLAGEVFHGAYTWAAWYWRALVREWGVLSPAEAVHRLTGLPAATFGLRDRGALRAGAWADIAVFDADRFGERGTAFEPNRLAEGMRHVLVNGAVTLRDGRPTGARGGQVLRRR